LSFAALRFLVVGLLIVLAIGLALLWAVVVASTAWMLTHPPRRTYASAVARGRPGDPGDLGRAFDSWSLRSGGVELPVWDVLGDAPGGPVIVMTHGWGDSRIGALVRLPSLLPIASRVVLWDLPGHGEASGTCRLGLRESDDLRVVVDGVRGTSRGDGKPNPSIPRHPATSLPLPRLPNAHRPEILLYGWSLGAGVSLEFAGREVGADIAGVIAESPYRLAATPARNVLRARGLPWRLTLGPALWLIGRGRLSPALFDRARDAARVRCPVLVLHGDQDAVSPVGDGHAIAAAVSTSPERERVGFEHGPRARAREDRGTRSIPLARARGSFTEIAGGGHNDLWTEPRFREQAQRAVREFLANLALK
jgi:pimeloyl-ACP methyl ester carboxylesterase